MCIFIIYPFLFLKSGTVVDDKFICKNNILGKSIEKYSYSDVQNFEISIKYGVQYDIILKSGKIINLCSHEIIGFNFFENEKKLHDFDRLLEIRAKRIVYKSIYSTSQNIRNFFRDDKYYNYFNKIFNGDISRETRRQGDGSVS